MSLLAQAILCFCYSMILQFQPYLKNELRYITCTYDTHVSLALLVPAALPNAQVPAVCLLLLVVALLPDFFSFKFCLARAAVWFSFPN